MLKKLTAVCISCLLLFGCVIPVSAESFNLNSQAVLVSDQVAAEEAYARASMGVDTYAAWGPNSVSLVHRYTDTAETTVQLAFLNVGFDPIDDCNVLIFYRQYGIWHSRPWRVGPIGVGISVSQRCSIGTHDAAYAYLVAVDGSESKSAKYVLK